MIVHQEQLFERYIVFLVYLEFRYIWIFSLQYYLYGLASSNVYLSELLHVPKLHIAFRELS